MTLGTRMATRIATSDRPRRGGKIGVDRSRRNERVSITLAILFALAVATGCASNHSFVRETEPDVDELVQALDAKDEDEEALFDGLYIPFVHMHLQLFTENEEPKYPDGHFWLSLRSWLPLFGIVDGDFTFYDTERSAYERGEFSSFLWGLWSRDLRTVQTRHGDRVERNYGLLWIFDVGPEVEYPASARR